MSRTVAPNSIAEVRTIAETPLADLTAQQITRVDRATATELSHMAEMAFEKVPPNLGVLGLVGGICVGRISRIEFNNLDEKDTLLSAAGRAIPDLNRVSWV